MDVYLEKHGPCLALSLGVDVIIFTFTFGHATEFV